MNISQALKERSRIAGRIAKLEREVNQYNQVKEGAEPALAAKNLLGELNMERKSLFDIKCKIAKANQNINDVLINLSETKAEMQFWTGLHTGSNSDTVSERYIIDGQYTVVEKKVTYVFDVVHVRAEIAKLQDSINRMQDMVDNYNATTQI